MNELLLVTENYNGLYEHNFVSTFEELEQNYMGKEDRQTRKNFSDFIKNNAGSQDVWSTFYVSCNTTLDIRACVDQIDLKDFLSGKFNSSIEEMNARLPGSIFNDGWYWDNDVERFSPKAIDIISKECPEHLALIGLKRHGEKTSLADIIKKASFIQENIACNKEASHRDIRVETKGI